MKNLALSMLALAALSGGTLSAQNIVGTWQGTLQGPQGPALRLVMKITRAADESLKTVSYSIDQGGAPINASKTTLDGGTLKIAFPSIGGNYEGKFAGDSITGTWTQGPGPAPLNFVRATDATAWTIPPPPPPPKIMAADADPAFEVATIKPSKPGTPGKGLGVGPNGNMTTRNYSLRDLIQFAYRLHPKQIEGGPSWYETDLYDITGKPDHEGIGNDRQIRAMVQKLLKDRFQLVYHTEKKELPVYAITVLKTGAKLTKSEANPVSLPGLGRGPNNLNVRNGTIAEFASLLQGGILDKPVIDQTGLTDRYDFQVKYTPDASQAIPGLPAPPPPADPADAPPDLFTAVQQQLGLKIESTKAPVDVIVIDKVSKPSED